MTSSSTTTVGPTLRMPRISRPVQILAVTALVLILAFTVHQSLHLRAGVMESARQEVTRLDMVFAEQTGRALDTVALIMRGAADDLANPLAAQGTAPATVTDMLRRRIAGVPQISEIALTDAAGRVLYSSRPGEEPGRMLSPAGMTLLHLHASQPGDSMEISEPLRGADGGWTTLLSQRMTNAAGGFAGIVVARLDLRYFEDFYRTVELEGNGAIILHRRDGVVLASLPHDEAAMGSNFGHLPPFRDVLAHATIGTVAMHSPIDGTERLVAIRALRRFPLAVSVSVSMDDILAPWWRQTAAFLLIALAASLVVVTLLFLLAHESRKGKALLGEYGSAREAAEQANLRLLEQMAERERTGEAMRQAQRIEAVGQLTGGVAHDFNNLLTVLLGNIDLLQQSPMLDRPMAERLERMRKAAERGATLTDQLLAFARRQPLIPSAMKLNDLVLEMTELLQSAAGGNIHIQTILASDPWPAKVDPTQIELVILNLAINARDAMPQGGRLTIETANVRLGPPERPEEPPAGDYVMVRVGDDGTGMTPEVQAKAFEPFFTTKGPGRGSGLGLSQVFGLARQSGGGAQIESTLGVGTSVRVYLPRATEQEAAGPALTRRTVVPGSASTVLLVDDDEAVRSTTGMILETMGYKVLENESGSTALATLEGESNVDILLTDVAMPGMNGPELARRVRQMRPTMPIVFFSGYADPEAVAGDTIRQRIVRKPFRATELAAQIEAALAEQREGA
jgi:signal transduction histidine kinase/ActR/RegA family two-component response regulator